MALNLVMDRCIIDQIQLALDPEAYKNFKKSAKYIKRKHGQKYWWYPGEATPN